MVDFITERLTLGQKEQLQILVTACQKAEPIHLGLPEDGDIYLFSSNMEGQILSCIIVCRVQEDIWECYAYTHPGFRRCGLFSHLLDVLCAEAEKAEKELVTSLIDLVFLLDGKSPDALAAVQAMEMNFWRSEYWMERRVTAEDSLMYPASLVSSPDVSSCFSAMTVTRKEIWEEGTKGWLFTAFGEDGRQMTGRCCLGHCRILSYDDSRFYLYHVEIHKEFRRRGWGKQLLAAVFAELPADSSVFLHVSSDNSAAVSLYKKTGFHLTETLSYYVY